ncbi:hypothetical protein DFAR_3500008 [Desulfarculales bacterium]
MGLALHFLAQARDTLRCEPKPAPSFSQRMARLTSLRQPLPLTPGSGLFVAPEYLVCLSTLNWLA